MRFRPAAIIAMVAGLVVCAPPAVADPITTAIGAVFTGIGFSATAASVLATVATTALTVGANYLVQSLFGSSGKGSGASQFGVQVQMQSGGVVPRSFLVGEDDACTPGSLIYHGATAAGGNTPNAFYCRTTSLCDLPGSVLTGLIVNGQRCTYDPDATPADDDFGIPIPEFNDGAKDNLWVQFFDDPASADPFMRTWFGSDPDYPYLADMVGVGIGYVRIIARVNQDIFPGSPSIKYICKGVPLYDVRNDTSAGGDGAERWDTPSGWSERGNATVLAYNIIRGIRYEGEWVYGGRDLAAARLPFASWAAGANECDALIALKDGGSERQYRVAGEIQFGRQPVDALEQIGQCSAARFAEIGGAYKTLVGPPGAAVLSFTDDDIIVTEEQKLDPFPNLDGTINGVAARYPEPTDGFGYRDYTLLNATYEAEDGDRRLAEAAAFDLCPYAVQVQRLAQGILTATRAFRRHNHAMPPSAFQVEPLDAVSWTSARESFSAKAFLVDRVVDGDDCNQAWSIAELDSSGFDWDETTDESTVASGVLSPQFPAAQAMVDWAAAGAAVEGDGGKQRAGVRLTWNTDVDDVEGVEFQIRLAADSTLRVSGQTRGWSLGALYITESLSGDTNYEARGRYIARSNRETSWSSWLSFTTPDIGTELSTQITAWLQQLDVTKQAALANVMAGLDAKLAALGQTVAGVVALINERIDGPGENAIVNYIGNANASITEARTIVDGLADLFVSVFAGDDIASGNALMQLTAGTGPNGSGASIKFLARALAADLLKEAGLEIWAYADSEGGASGWVLRGDKGIIRTSAGDELNALMLTTQGEPLDTPITTEGSDAVIRADLTGRQSRHITVMDDDAEVRAPTGITSMDYTHLLKQDDTGSREPSWSSEFLLPHPTLSGEQLLPGAINIISHKILSTNPVRITAKHDGVFTETPTIALRNTIFDGFYAVNSYSGIDISNLDFVPGNLILLLAYGKAHNYSNVAGTNVTVSDASLPDWVPFASDGAQYGIVSNANRIRGLWRIADGNEGVVSPLVFGGSAATKQFVGTFMAISFDFLGGAATFDGAPTAKVSSSTAIGTQTMEGDSHAAPVFAFSWAAIASEGGVSSWPDQSFSVTPDHNIASPSYGVSRSRFKAKRYTSSPADVTSDLSFADFKGLISGSIYLAS